MVFAWLLDTFTCEFAVVLSILKMCINTVRTANNIIPTGRHLLQFLRSTSRQVLRIVDKMVIYYSQLDSWSLGTLLSFPL